MQLGPLSVCSLFRDAVFSNAARIDHASNQERIETEQAMPTTLATCVSTVGGQPA